VLRLLAVALAAFHIGSILALGNRAPGPFISNLVQLAASTLAAAACLLRMRETRGLARRFYLLASVSMGLWSLGQLSFTYYENYLQAAIPSLSFTDVAFLSFYLPLAALVFLRPAEEGKTIEWTRALDLAQLGVVFSAVYLYYFFYLASFMQTRVAMLEWVVNVVYDVLNIFLIGGLLYRVVSPSDRQWRGHYGRLAGVWAIYAIGDTTYRYGLLVWGLKTGCWLDLAYSMPFLVMTLMFSSPPAQDVAASTACDVDHGERVCFLLLILAPIAAMLLALDIVRANYLLGSIILFSSFLLYSVRLAITQYRKHNTLKMLGDAEMKFRLLFESNPQPMWVFDKQTLHFLEVNPAATERYGYTREEFLAMKLTDVRPEDEVPSLLKVLAQGAERTYSGHWRHRTKDGRLFEVEVAARNITFAGRAARLVIINDVTERKLLEAQFRQAQKMEAVGTLAGGIAHDFNNLLTVISGYSYMLKESLTDDRKLAEDIGQIEQAAEKAAALTRQLLAFSRRQVLEPKTIVLNDVVRGMEKMLRRVIGEDIELITVPSPDLGLVRADPGQIEQVLMNLAVNARDAMPKGGKLVFETENVELDEAYARSHMGARTGSYVQLAVSDTGTGMDAETMSHIFEPFFTTKGMGRGTGLGLSTVYGIVKQSGGYIWAYSEPGHGTTFKIYLPLVQGESESKPAESREPARHGSSTVLLVEDDEAVRDLATRILRQHGYSVLPASGGAEAELLCRRFEGKIHLLVTDVVMPGMSGAKLARRLRRQRPEIRVLFISGYTDNVLQHGILKSNTAFLQKPFSAHSLAEKVASVLESSTQYLVPST
jgi:hypothetical protein